MADSRTELLEEDLKTQYRSCVMRAACLAQDKPAMSEAVKTLEAHESADRWKLPDAEEIVTILDQGPDDSKQVRQADHVRQGLCVLDADHVGCASKRRSTTGLVTVVGSTLCEPRK